MLPGPSIRAVIDVKSGAVDPDRGRVALAIHGNQRSRLAAACLQRGYGPGPAGPVAGRGQGVRIVVSDDDGAAVVGQADSVGRLVKVLSAGPGYGLWLLPAGDGFRGRSWTPDAQNENGGRRHPSGKSSHRPTPATRAVKIPGLYPRMGSVAQTKPRLATRRYRRQFGFRRPLHQGRTTPDCSTGAP